MLNLYSKLNKRGSKELAEALPIFSFENNKVVFKDGYVAVGYKVRCAEMETWSGGDYQAFNNSLLQQLSTLEEGSIVQKTDIYYDREYLGNVSAKEYFELKTHRHLLYRLVLNHDSYLFISIPPANKKKYKINPLNTLLLATPALLTNVFERIEHTLELAENKAEEFIKGVDVGGISFQRLQEDELKAFYSKYYTLNFKDTFSGNLFCDIQADQDGITVGDQRLNIISMIGQGGYLNDSVRNYSGVTSPYTFSIGNYLQLPHITTTTLKIENTEKALEKLDFKKKMNRSMDWMATQDNEVMANEIDEFTQIVRQVGSQIVSLGLNVMVYENDPALRKNYLERVVAGIRAMAGAESIIESIDTLAIFMANTPGNANNNYRWMMMSDEMATKYFNFTSNYKTEAYGDLLADRFLNPVKVNFFNSNLSNQNVIVIGPSGSGKSFTNGFFMIQRHERGPRQVIIDVGGTYKNTLLALNGEQFNDTYIEYDQERQPSFAPFLAPKDKSGVYIVDTDKINFIMSLLFTIVKGKEALHVRQVEKSILQTIITNYYEHISENNLPAKFSTFYEYVQYLQKRIDEDPIIQSSFKFLDIEEFLIVLKPFYDGPYQALLNSNTQQDLSEYRLVCFDLARIKGDTMIYPIISQLIIQLVLDQLSKFPDDEKYIYMDEAWIMLEGSLSEFMETMFRTVRKLKGAIWIITQTIEDIANSSIASAILGNADTKVLLKHTDQNMIDQVVNTLGLTTHQTELFASLRKAQDYREIFIKMADTAKVFAIEASPYHATVLSSKPDERNEFIRLLRKYGNQSLAIEEFVQRKVNTPE